jgi:Cu(I)/Ag(I) efflux system membrane fusion protein
MKFRLFIFLLCMLLAGCRESARNTPEVADIQMSLTVDPTPPVVGDATLLITVKDNAGNPVEVQKIAVRGDMTHAGMVPVMGEEATKTDAGYTAPLTWSMGGDWIVTVEATLNDGRVVSQEFELTVGS